MIASSTIGKQAAGLAEEVPAGVAGLVATVKERLPDSLPDVSLPDVSLPDLASRLRRPDVDLADLASRLRLPDVDVAELRDRLRDLPAVGTAQPDRRPLA